MRYEGAVGFDLMVDSPSKCFRGLSSQVVSGIGLAVLLYAGLISLFMQDIAPFLQDPMGCISKSTSDSVGGGAPPTMTPPRGREGPPKDVPVDGDLNVSMYTSKAGWKIQSSSSSSKNALSNVLLVPTRIKLTYTPGNGSGRV